MTPRSLLVACAAAALAAPGSAQFTSSLFLDTDAGVSCKSGSGNSTKTDFVSAPKNTQIPPSTFNWRLSGNASQGSGASALTAMQTLWAASSTTNGGSMGLSGIARGTNTQVTFTTPSTSKNGQPGDVAFLARMTGPKGAKGVIRISWQTLFTEKASAKASVDVHADNSTEWNGGDTEGGIDGVDIPAAFDANGDLSLRITIGGDQTGPGQFIYSRLYARLTYKFVEPVTASLKITPYGSGCQGVTATGAVTDFPNHHLVSLKVSGGYPNGVLVETVGSQSLALPLPGGCSLLSNALVILIRNTDASGDFAHTYTVSKFQSSLTYHQYLPVAWVNNALEIRASNGLRIEAIRAR